MSEVELVKAVWGSDPRFSDGITYRYERSEGRAVLKRRCVIPASELRMATGDHSYRVTVDSGNFFYLAAVGEPPIADWPLTYRILTIPAGADVIPYQSRHGLIAEGRNEMHGLDGALPNEDLFAEPLRQQVALPL